MTKGIRLINKLMKLERKETFNTKGLTRWIEEVRTISVIQNLRCPCLINFLYPSGCFYQEDYHKLPPYKYRGRDYCGKKCPRSKIWIKLMRYVRHNLDRNLETKAYLLEQLRTLL